jgi:hypothetical protein
VVFAGNLTISATTIVDLNVGAGGSVSVSGKVILESGSVLQLTASSLETNQVVTVLSADGGIQGNFSQITVVSADPNECGVVQSVTPINSDNGGGGTLTVTVAVDSSGCVGATSSSLSTGAIIGIAVGCTCAAVVLIVAAVLFMRWNRNAHTRLMNQKIAEADLAQL